MRNLWLALGLTLWCLAATAQRQHFVHYGVKEGLPHSEISSLYQDTRGFIWGTSNGGGVTRFDGKNFRNFDVRDGLVHNIVRGVTEDSVGNIWFGTLGGGACYFNGDTFTTFEHPNLIGTKNVYAMHTDPSGGVWLATDSGLFCYQNDTVFDLARAFDLPYNPVIGVNGDRQGRIWFGLSEYGLVCYDHGEIRTWTVDDGLTSNEIFSCYQDLAGNIWAGTFDGVNRLQPNGGDFKISTWSPATGFPDAFVFDFAEDRSGRLWCGTQQNGLGYYDSMRGEWTFMGGNSGAPSATAFHLITDREGNLWVSFWGHSITRWSDDRIVSWHAESDFQDLHSALIADGDSGVLMLRSTGIYRLQNGDRAPTRIYEDLLNVQLYTIYQDRKGRLWGSDQASVFFIENGKMTYFSANDSVPLNFVRGITEDEEGNIWFSSWSNGIISWDGKEFRKHTYEEGLVGGFFYCAFRDAEGRLWFGSWGDGVSCYDHGQWLNYSISDGIPSDKVSSVSQDRDGNIWVGTYGGGIAQFDGKKFQAITREDGLSHGTVLDLTQGPDRGLWIATLNAMDRLDLNAWAEGEVQLRSYSAKDGFTEEPMLNSALADDKYVWVGTKQGLFRIDPFEQVVEIAAPTCMLTGMDVSYQPKDWGALAVDPFTGLPPTAELSHQENRLTFHFLGISTSQPEALSYRYQLSPLDEKWSPYTVQNSVTYHDLSPGEYTFQVQACVDGDCGKSATYQITIAPPFWQRAWFIILCAVLLILLVVLIIRLREKQSRKVRRELEYKVQKRTARIERQKEIIEAKNKDITDSIRYAQRIQEAILPPQRLFKEWLPNSFVLYEPKDIVSGDFYWAEKVDNTRFVAAADCTGHGVPGAMVSVMGANGLNRCIKEFGLRDPAQILDQLAKVVASNFERSDSAVRDGMDIALCAINGNELSYCGANNPLWLIREGDVPLTRTNGTEVPAKSTEGKLHLYECKADKQPIGHYDDRKPFTSHHFRLQPGDTIYLFSDGFADQFGGEKNKKLKSANFRRLLLSMQAQSMDQQRYQLEQFFKSWMGDHEQIDDVCVIGLRV